MLRCLRKSPERRWQSMADLKVALEDLREESDAPTCAGTPFDAVPRPLEDNPRRASRSRIAALAFGALVAGDAATARGRAHDLSDQAHVGRRLDRLSSHLTRRKDARVRLRPQRRQQSRHLGSADSRRASGQTDPVTQPTKSSPRSRPTAAGSLFSPAGSAAASTSSRRSAAKNGFSPREASRRAFHPTESGSPTVSPNKPAAESTWRQPPAVQPAPSPAASIGPSPPSGHQTAVTCCSGRSATATPRRRTTSIGTWRRSPAGRPYRTDARGAAPRRIPGVSGTAVAGCLGHRGKPHPLSRHRRGLLEHVAGGHLSGPLARQRQAATGDVRHDRRSGGLGHLGRTDGVHQPDDGGGHLEPADRRQSRHGGGPLKRVTQDAADDYDPTLSDDGATLVFRSRRAGRFGVVLKRLATSAETVLTRMPADHFPAVSRDGTKVAYSFRQNGKMPDLRRGRGRWITRARLRRLRRGGGVVAGRRPDSLCRCGRSVGVGS